MLSGAFLNILSHGPFKKSEDALEVSLNSYGLIRTYQLWMETSTGIIDYDERLYGRSKSHLDDFSLL
jgi:hypothetical protein